MINDISYTIQFYLNVYQRVGSAILVQNHEFNTTHSYNENNM